MDIIKTYLENMFSTLPKTPEILKIKNDLLSNMEDKYYELKQQGKTENEAIGIVISEFGNIEELMQEMNVNTNTTSAPVPQQPAITVSTVNTAAAEQFLADKKTTSGLNAIGVSLCILGAAALLLFIQTAEITKSDNWIFPGIASLLFLVAIAVGLFIFSDQKMNKHSFLQDPFRLDQHTRQIIMRRQEVFAPKKLAATISGIVLCIFSAFAVLVPALLNEENLILYGVCVLLVIVAVAVHFLVRFGTMQEGYNLLLQQNDFKPNNEKNKGDIIIGAVAGVWWPLVTCGYLLYSFITSSWELSWIVWPVAGLLFGGFSAVISTIYQTKSVN